MSFQFNQVISSSAKLIYSCVDLVDCLSDRTLPTLDLISFSVGVLAVGEGRQQRSLIHSLGHSAFTHTNNARLAAELKRIGGEGDWGCAQDRGTT